MSFFNSDVVRAEMTEISELQEDVYGNVFKFPSMNKEEKLEPPIIIETKEINLPDPVKSTVVKKPKELYLECESEPENIEEEVKVVVADTVVETPTPASEPEKT